MLMFSEKHFLRCLSVEPKCQALEAPKLNEQVNDRLEKIGKDPHFGSEKKLYKFQGQILDLAGPLTCLWADLLNSDIKIKKEDIILMVQRILVLVGSASDFISQERRQILWSCLNPLIKDISMEEDGKGKGTTLFDGGFIEKATKRIKDEKALSKVTGTKKITLQPNIIVTPKTRLIYDVFLDKGASARYSGRRSQCQQLSS